MSFLARKVRGPLWAQAGEAGRWARPDYPFELLPDLIDKDGSGVSVWEVKSKVDPALKRIAAALTVAPNSSKTIQSVEFRLVDKSRVEALGIVVTVSPGDTQDKEINGLHRELSPLTAARAIALLRLMNRKAQAFSAKEVARFIAEGILHAHLPPGVLNQQLLWSLHQQYHAIKIVVPKT